MSQPKVNLIGQKWWPVGTKDGRLARSVQKAQNWQIFLLQLFPACATCPKSDISTKLDILLYMKLYVIFKWNNLLGQAWELLSLNSLSLYKTSRARSLPLSLEPPSLAFVCITKAILGDIPLLCLGTLDQTQLPLGWGSLRIILSSKRCFGSDFGLVLQLSIKGNISLPLSLFYTFA